MIDKNKAYRFRGDSERWVVGTDSLGLGRLLCSKPGSMTISCAEHLHERGILLGYPELPGDDWEFCEAGEHEMWWCDGCVRWQDYKFSSTDCYGFIYCRKKKPAYRSGEMCKADEGSDDLARDAWRDGHVIYWTTDPAKGKNLLS